MSVGLNRANLFGLVKEVSPAEYLAPTVGTQILPLRPGNELSYEPEILENDELLDDIGEAKSAIGKEVVSGKHGAYLRHSGIEGQEPQLGPLYESIMGAKYIVPVEQLTIAGSTISILKVADGTLFRQGQALLGKDGVNGYWIRNVAKIDGNDIHLNFNLDVAPALGIGLGKAIIYLPVAQGHPTFSTTKYLGNGFAKEASAGNTATSFDLTAAANGYGEVEFSYEGTKYFFNPIIITAANKFFDFTDDSGPLVVSIPEGVYKTPIELADALNAALNAVSAEDFTFKYNNQTGKFETESTSVVLSLNFLTGPNNANTIALAIGYTKTDHVGATSYISDNEQSYVLSITPQFDGGDIIVLKNVQLFVGDPTDNVCICAQEVSISVSKEVEDVDCMCEPTGIAEKIPVGRAAEMNITASLKKHDASLLDAMLKNKGIAAMFNAGPKTGGNFVPGKCFNSYLQTATVSKYTTTGDSFIQVEMTLKGFISSTTKDIYLNFV